jgi:hypothetical protein
LLGSEYGAPLTPQVELPQDSADSLREPLLSDLLALLAGLPERVRRLRISGLRTANDPRVQYALAALLVARGVQAAPPGQPEGGDAAAAVPHRSLRALALDMPLPLVLVEALLESHPHLQQLELLVCDPQTGWSKERPWRPRLRGCLRKLHLEFQDTPMALDVGQVASCCPELQELELEGCSVMGTPAVDRLGQLQVLQLPEVGTGVGPAGRCRAWVLCWGAPAQPRPAAVS